MSDIIWNEETKKRFDLMISKMPLFHRRMAESMVSNKALSIAKERGSTIIEEADVIKAFFTGVPKPFEWLMIKLMDEVGFDYKKYGLGME